LVQDSEFGAFSNLSKLGECELLRHSRHFGCSIEELRSFEWKRKIVDGQGFRFGELGRIGCLYKAIKPGVENALPIDPELPGTAIVDEEQNVIAAHVDCTNYTEDQFQRSFGGLEVTAFSGAAAAIE
jgi:hypothetical protein